MSSEQRQFWQWVTQPRDLNEDATAISELLAPHRHLTQTQALSIYNNAYHQRLVDVSSALFPVLFNSLGKELYTQIMITYLQEFPPRSGPINRIGDSLANFLLMRPEFKNIPAAADIARLEMLLGQLFDCADETSFQLGALYALPTEEWAGMTWKPKLDWALMHSRFDLEEYWQKVQGFIAHKGEPGETDFGINLLAQTPERDTPNFLVFRKEHTMQFQHITPALSTFLLLVTQQLTFAQICTELATRFPDEDTAAISLSLLLKSIEMGLLRGPRRA
jgi:hypothetical protein